MEEMDYATSAASSSTTAAALPPIPPGADPMTMEALEATMDGEDEGGSAPHQWTRERQQHRGEGGEMGDAAQQRRVFADGGEQANCEWWTLAEKRELETELELTRCQLQAVSSGLYQKSWAQYTGEEIITFF